MMSKFCVAAVFLFIGCGGDSPDPTPQVDAPAGGGTCATYDTCTVNDDCASNQCHVFNGSGITVCTQTCSAANPCPNDSAGNPIACNMMGICKPTVANPGTGSCTP